MFELHRNGGKLAYALKSEYKANMSSPQVLKIRHEIEGALARRFEGALSPLARLGREKSPTDIAALDSLLGSGLPIGGLSELVGMESSGRTTIALSLLSKIASHETAAAWIDVSDAFDPEGAARCGVDLRRLLWVRCNRCPVVAVEQNDPHQSLLAPSGRDPSYLQVPRSSGSPHPRSEAHGMSEAVASLLQSQPRSAASKDRRARRIIGTPGALNRPLTQFPLASPYREEEVPTDRIPARRGVADANTAGVPKRASSELQQGKPLLPNHSVALPMQRTGQHSWNALDRALRSADLLLQAGGFSLLVLDLGSVPAEMAARIPLATWFRFRAACERTSTTLLLLTQYPCAKSSADQTVRLRAGEMQSQSGVLTGIQFAAAMERQRRVISKSNVVSIRKPPQSECDGAWLAQALWAVRS